MKSYASFIPALLLLLGAQTVAAYPVDDSERTGIARLEGYHWSLSTPTGKEIVPFGARLGTAAITPLFKGETFDLPPSDPRFESQVRNIIQRHGANISISVLDLSDRDRPVYAGINDRHSYIPGSTGKVLVALALLSKLQVLYPNNPELRERVLHDTMITAGPIINEDSHVVPFWNRDAGKLYFRPIIESDEANLWTFLDWMISASSNGAGSAIINQLVLLDHFGRNYPPAPSQAATFLRNTSSGAKAQTVTRMMRESIIRAGFNPAELIQTSVFTKEGRKQIPSRGSSATTRSFIGLLLKMEQGRLIDEFTSAELKRLMYSTQKRIRYADAPELEDAVVLFKAGSLYKCGGPCEQYEGTNLNLLSGVVGVEDGDHHYLVVISSNVLRKNSSNMHRAIAGEIHKLIKSRYRSPVTVFGPQ